MREANLNKASNNDKPMTRDTITKTNGNAISATRPEIMSQVQFGKLVYEAPGTHHESNLFKNRFSLLAHMLPLKIKVK